MYHFIYFFNRIFLFIKFDIFYISKNYTFNFQCKPIPPLKIFFPEKIVCCSQLIPPSATHVNLSECVHFLSSSTLSSSVSSTSSSSSSICSLTLPVNCLEPLNLPQSIKVLDTGKFNNYIFNLPPLLTTLILGPNFNCPIFALPHSIQVIKLGSSFTYPLPYLPTNLLELHIHTINSHSFSHISSLPPFFRTLKVYSHTPLECQSWDHFFISFPTNNNIATLHLYNVYVPPLYNLPSLQNLRINGNVGVVVPEGIKQLKLGGSYNLPLPNLPHNITHLKFGHSFNSTISELPLSLSHLTFGDMFDQPLPHFSSCKNLTHVTFGYCFNRELIVEEGMEEYIFPYVKFIKFGQQFDQCLDIYLPESLVSLEIGQAYSKKIYLKDYPNLQHLTLLAGIEGTD